MYNTTSIYSFYSTGAAAEINKRRRRLRLGLTTGSPEREPEGEGDKDTFLLDTLL
jgi:hypothetical protein